MKYKILYIKELILSNSFTNLIINLDLFKFFYLLFLALGFKMSITLIRSRRRLVQANSYNSPHHRKNKKLLATTQAERAQRNREKKRAQLDKLKNKNKPKAKKRPKRAKMPYRFKYYQFQDYKFKDELEELEEIN